MCVCVCFGFVLRAIIYRTRKKHKSGWKTEKKRGKISKQVKYRQIYRTRIFPCCFPSLPLYPSPPASQLPVLSVFLCEALIFNKHSRGMQWGGGTGQG